MADAKRESVGFARRLARERLILSATEQIIARMDEQGTLRSDLADILGVTKAEVSQRLSGDRNLTLGTLAAMADALGCRFTITLRTGTEPTEFDYRAEYALSASGRSEP